MASETSTNPTSLGFVPDGWKIRSIGSLCLKITSGGTPSRKNVLFFANGSVRWFKTQELNDWFIEDSKEMITEDAVKSSSAKLLPPNTILMAMYGDGSTITSLGILKKEATCNQACCAMIADPEQCDYRYLFYSLKYHRTHFIHLATGGAQRNLSGALIRNFLIKIPSLEKQRVISDILGSLDDKIELNRRMNATLEESARALFKSWFVDFDPVRAKMEGRQPEGIDAETAALFPDRLVESTLGLMPEGWEVKPLDEVADFLNGLALQKYPAEDDEYLPAIKIRELRQGYADETSDKISPKVDPHYIIYNGDVIFSWSGSPGRLHLTEG